MKLKYLLCFLLFPWAAFGVNTNQVDNLWVPVSARFSYGTPAVGKVFTSDASGFASWANLSATGGVNDARYVIKSGFSSGAQAVDGNFTMSSTNFAHRLIVGTNAFATPVAPLTIQAVTTTGAGIWIKNNTGVPTGQSWMAIGADPAVASAIVGAGSSNLTLEFYNANSYIAHPKGGRLDITEYNGNIYFRGSAGIATLGLNCPTLIGYAPSTLVIGSGTTAIGVGGVAFSNLTTVTASIDSQNIAAHNEWSTNIALASARAGSACSIRIFTKTDMIDYAAYCTNNGFVTIQLFNREVVLSVNPTNQTIGADVINR